MIVNGSEIATNRFPVITSTGNPALILMGREN